MNEPLLTDCQFNDDGPPWICRRCGVPYRGKWPTPPTRNCGVGTRRLQEAAADLGMTVGDAWRWAHAVAKWLASSRPRRTPAEVAAIYAEHCDPCDDRVGARCGLCRCHVAAQGFPLANKLAMGTEHCPDGKW